MRMRCPVWWQVEMFVVSNLSQVVEHDQLVSHLICPAVPTGPVSSVVFFMKGLLPSWDRYCLLALPHVSCAALATRVVALLEDMHPSMEPAGLSSPACQCESRYMCTVIEEIKAEWAQQTDKANYPSGISAPQAQMVITKPLPLKISQGRSLWPETSRNFPCPSDTQRDHNMCSCQTMDITFSQAWHSPVL